MPAAVVRPSTPQSPARARSRRSAHNRAAVAHPRAALILFAALAMAFLGLGPGVAGATGTATTPTTTTASSSSSATSSTAPPGSGAQSQISAGEAEVTTLENQISEQQAVLDQTDEAYNQAEVNLTSTKQSLATTSAALASTRTRLATEKAQLRADAVGNYENDTSSSAVASIFASPTSQAQTADLYQQIGADNVAADVARVKAGQRQLTATQAKLLSEQQAETTQLNQADQAQQSASAASAQSEATLAQVKGTLATEIVQQAAAQAAAAAKAAAAATSPAAAQTAATQANQAAQVASTLGGGSAAAVNATTAANQATGAAASTTASSTASTPVPTPPVAVASGGNPQAAGLAAVHGAMKYLGVPYVWGGASMAGLDCSGLTMLAWAQAGVTMDHSAADQYNSFPHVSLTNLEPGDLLFYNLDGSGIDHVVMYVGPYLDGQPTAYGSGTIIQAAHTGTFVTFDPLWYQGLVGAARP